MLLSYGDMQEHQFLRMWDDAEYVTDNEIVRKGLTPPSLVGAFGVRVQGNWQPLTLISHMVDVELHGLDPTGHHRTSVWIHLANTLLLFFALVVLARSPRAGGRSVECGPPLLYKGAFAAGLFGLHPLHVESVAWVAERKDLVSGFFFLLTLIAYARWVARPGRLRYGVVFIALTLGLMSKSMLVTTPLILLLLDVWPLRRLELRPVGARTGGIGPLIVEKLPLLVPVAIVSTLAILTQRESESVMSLARFSLDDRVGNAIAAYGFYLGKFLMPTDLAAFYPLPVFVDSPLEVSVRVLLSGVGLAILASAAWILRDRAPYVLMGFLWCLVMLLPVIGIVQVGSQAWADRYMYLPMIGPIVIVTWGAADLSAPLRRALPRLSGLVMAGCALLVVAALGYMTSKQVQVWSSSDRLWEHALEAVPNNYRASYQLALLRVADHRYRSALEYLRSAETMAPETPEIVRLSGLVYMKLRRLDEAYPYLVRSLRFFPEDARIHHALGHVAMAREQWEEAEKSLARAVELAPRNPSYRRSLRRARLSRR